MIDTRSEHVLTWSVVSVETGIRFEFLPELLLSGRTRRCNWPLLLLLFCRWRQRIMSAWKRYVVNCWCQYPTRQISSFFLYSLYLNEFRGKIAKVSLVACFMKHQHGDKVMMRSKWLLYMSKNKFVACANLYSKRRIYKTYKGIKIVRSIGHIYAHALHWHDTYSKRRTITR